MGGLILYNQFMECRKGSGNLWTALVACPGLKDKNQERYGKCNIMGIIGQVRKNNI